MKIRIFVCAVLAVLTIHSTAFGADTTLGDCEYSTVNSALSGASYGDTIRCPTDTANWGSSAVSIPNGVSLIGQGIGSTVISSSSYKVHSLGNYSRLEGFEFTNGFAKSSCGQNWAIVDCKFVAASYDSSASGNFIGGTGCSKFPTGVYHGCWFENLRIVLQGTAIPSKDWVTYYPDRNSYQYKIFFEGGTFKCPDCYNNAVDDTFGSNKVVRFNNFDESPLGSHGGRNVYTAAGRGSVSRNIYRNNWDHTNPTDPGDASYAYFMRSGTGFLFDNYCTDDGSTNLCEADFSMERAPSYGSYETCADDTVADTQPHPEGGSPGMLCRDGIGAGADLGINALSGMDVIYTYGQASAPVYFWNHKRNSVQSTMNFSNGTDTILNENREFFRDSGENGVTTGLYANRPTCDASKENHGYWATDMGGNWNSTSEWSGDDGALYVCDGVDTWDLYYTPIDYPHPLVDPETEPDIDPPVLSALSPSTQQACSPGPTADVTISLTTDETATCKFHSSDVAYDSMGTTFSSTNSTSHSHGLTGLSCNSTQTYYVRCQDDEATPNQNDTSSIITFPIASTSDSTAPTLSTQVLGSDGRTLTLTFDEAVVIGAGGNDDWTLNTDADDAVTVSYTSGASSDALIYTTNRVVVSTETLTLEYAQPGNGVEDYAGNDLVSISTPESVTNSSSQTTSEATYTLWPTSIDVSALDNTQEVAGNPVELGVKFQSSVSGEILAIRFYEPTNSDGTHVGSLWDSDGNLLDSVEFTEGNAPLPCWQQESFDSPISINADTTYVASVHMADGDWISTFEGYNTGVDSPPLSAPASTAESWNGVYLYTATSAFPYMGSIADRNYWVDIVFRKASTGGAGEGGGFVISDGCTVQ